MFREIPWPLCFLKTVYMSIKSNRLNAKLKSTGFETGVDLLSATKKTATKTKARRKMKNEKYCSLSNGNDCKLTRSMELQRKLNPPKGNHCKKETVIIERTNLLKSQKCKQTQIRKARDNSSHWKSKTTASLE